VTRRVQEDWAESATPPRPMGGMMGARRGVFFSISVDEWDLSTQEHVRDFLAAVGPYLKSHEKQARAREAVRRIGRE
jgi:hypothetical protein